MIYNVKLYENEQKKLNINHNRGGKYANEMYV